MLATPGLDLPVGAASPTGPSPTPAPAQFVRGAYGKDASNGGFDVMAANGFNSVMTGPYKELLDPLAADRLKGVVWLGAFQNAPTCGFEKDDAYVTSRVSSIAGNPVILAYFLGDEPHVSECPKAPELFRERSDLVHRLDPGSTTFTVIQASENGVAHDYAPWAGAVDIIGFDVYPCAKAKATCDFGLVDAAISAIEGAGIKRYWAVIQDFQDCYYRLPTPSELAAQFDHWARSNMSGYFVFSWNYQPADTKCAGAVLDSHPDNITQLKFENSRTFTQSFLKTPQPSASGLDPLSTALLTVSIVAGIMIAIAVLTRWFRRPSGHE